MAITNYIYYCSGLKKWNLGPQELNRVSRDRKATVADKASVKGQGDRQLKWAIWAVPMISLVFEVFFPEHLAHATVLLMPSACDSP